MMKSEPTEEEMRRFVEEAPEDMPTTWEEFLAETLSREWYALAMQAQAQESA